MRDFTAQGQAVQLVELAEDEVRAYVGEPIPPRSRSEEGSSPTMDEPNGGPEGRVGGAETPDGSPPELADDERQPNSSELRRGGDSLELGTPDEQEQQLIEQQAATLRRILRDHGVQIQELDSEKAQVGPSVIRYRIRLRPGAKLSTLRARAEDIGRELAARSTPFIDNVAGENYVGLDLERPRRQVVPLLPAIEALPIPGHATASTRCWRRAGWRSGAFGSGSAPAHPGCRINAVGEDGIPARSVVEFDCEASTRAS